MVLKLAADFILSENYAVIRHLFRKLQLSFVRVSCSFSFACVTFIQNEVSRAQGIPCRSLKMARTL